MTRCQLEGADELLATLREAQQRHIILVPRGKHVGIWSPGRRVPKSIRNTIQEHRQEILRMIARSEIWTCPNPGLHRETFSLFAGYAVCDTCSRLRREIVEMDTPTRSQPGRKITEAA